MAEKKKRRIGVLTSGGDAPGLNAVIRAVVKTASGLGYEVLGIQQGYEGLLGETHYRMLTGADVRGLLPMGGTVLQTTNKGHFGGKHVVGVENDPYDEALANIKKLGICSRIEFKSIDHRFRRCRRRICWR